MEKFMEDCLNAHNHYRALHGSPPLEIKPKLNEYATVWATYLAKKGDRSRRKTEPFGENVYVVFEGDIGRSGPVIDAVDSWYEESKFYEFGVEQPPFLKTVRHFTQLVWKGSLFIGFGMVTTPAGQTYIVCNYDPPGNVENEFAENVLPEVEGGVSKTEGGEEGEEEGEEGEAAPEAEEEGNETEEEGQAETAEQVPLRAKKLRIKALEPKMKTVESMCRLYSVPSEKIRVWSVWLTQVGEEAESWQKWLHSYIDLLLRMAARLKELEDAEEEKISMTPETGEQLRRIFAFEEDTVSEDGIEYPPGVTDFYDIEEVLAKIVSSGDSNDGKSEAEGDKLPDGLEEFAEDGAPPGKPTDDEEDEESRMAGGADQPEDEEATEDAAVEGEGAEEVPEDTVAPEEEEEDDEDDGLPQEWPVGIQWKPFGDQEPHPWEMFEPIQMPSTPDELRQMIKDFTHQATIYRSYYKHWQETAEQAIREIVGRRVMPTAKMQGILDENDLEASLRACLGLPAGAFRKSDICFAPPGKIAAMMAMAERVGTVEFIKDMARADENIPYFFYRTALPDIEIAIQHDDEEIILPDPGMEVISCSSGFLRFNLNDKPGRGAICSAGDG